MAKTRLNISFDEDLASFIRVYAQENRTTAADVITQFILSLKRQSTVDIMDIIITNPDFQKALIQVQSRLRDGSAKWYTFEEVFGE
ncbi:MAG: hypothetical protein A2161_07130 [Candidatus Schekmanbacteria bacterium RBG_13_48_7]|uniref:Uncharacterized protein n=1 Tax=Candidatus Schekmanbacteria bacterium RBG_13_48_7 TaxID=1817878 RepID=A0A1F7RRW7_9BACT|nr:MAG: hypothetical protein A2161_07130 [Candidatus Schekmanbacteria bacterium RBG_13_48_7]